MDTWDQQIAEICRWLDRMTKAKAPAPGYRLTLVVPMTGSVRFEWRKAERNSLFEV